jgi:hypothetical protein
MVQGKEVYMENDLTRIAISKKLRDELIEMRRGRDTTEDVVQKLLDHYRATAPVPA